MKINSWLLFFLLLSYCTAGAQQDTLRFRDLVRSVLVDRSKDQKQYPTPPLVTNEVVLFMQEEFKKNDSAQYYFLQLSTDSMRTHYPRYGEALQYFFRKDLFATMLSLSVHWNPDIRVYSQTELQKLIHRGMLINDQKLKTGKRRAEFQLGIRFLIFVLEQTPWSIPGSENSTIHSMYIYSICKSLDYLTGERKMIQRQHYYSISDQQIQQSIIQWKQHIKDAH